MSNFVIVLIISYFQGKNLKNILNFIKRIRIFYEWPMPRAAACRLLYSRAILWYDFVRKRGFPI